MTDSHATDRRSTEILGGSWAWKIGAFLVLGFVLVLALAIVDRQRRPQIESFSEVTAVGDRAYFAPGPDPAAPTVLKWSGGQVQVAAAEHVKMRDTSMRKVGQDDATGVSIYRATPKKGEEGPGGLFVKVAPGEYLPAKP